VLKSTQFIYIFLGVIGILGWNAWAIQRDAKLLDAYNQPTPKEVYCSQLPQPHPDCTVE
jgi:hypothetical protein